MAPAASNVDYGKIVELECPDVSDRVVVVEYTLGPTRGPVAGATTNAVFVSHFADGWRVWLQSA